MQYNQFCDYNRLLFCVLLLAGTFGFISVACSPQLDYPEARRSDHSDTYHGVQVSDPYRWMEDMDSEETVSWIDAQERLLEDYLKGPVRGKLKSRIKAYQNITSYGLPVKAGGKYFYTETPPHKSRPVLYVERIGSGQARELINPDKDFDSESRQLNSFSASPGGRYVAYQVSEDVSQWRTIHILDVETGRRLKDVVEGVHSTIPTISWTPDEKGFYYTRFELPEEGESLNASVESPDIYYHEVGTPQSQDKLIYEDPSDPNRMFIPTVTDDGLFLIISAREGSDPDNEILFKELGGQGEVQRLNLDVEAAYTFLGNKDTRWWFYTTADAPNGRIVAVDMNRPKQDDWDEIIPEDPDAAIAGGSLTGGNALGMYGNKLVIMYLEGVRRSVKVFGLDGEHLYDVKLPDTGSIWGGFSGGQNEDELFYRFLGLNYPRLVYRLDLSGGESELFKGPDLNFDSEDYETRIVSYRSKDGTEVPMFVTLKKGMKRNGSHPVFMYGYGAFGWVAFPWYQPQILTWLEMGGIYAIPAIRGGGEYGEEWHKAGMKTNRQNAIDDYIAAAEWLIDRGYTSPGKMVANGGSASGMVAAAAVLQRPELFGAALIDIPALDMLRYHKFTAAGFWIQEFGSVEDENEFQALYGYSPYHNIQQGGCYPPMLVTVGEKDETAVPMHGYKFIAAMQYAQECNSPALLKVVRGAGHRFGKTPDQRAQTWADQLAFLVRVLDLRPEFK